MAFFDSKGLIYTNQMPRETTVNVNYIRDVLGKFLKVSKQNRPAMGAGELWFHWKLYSFAQRCLGDCLYGSQADPSDLAPPPPFTGSDPSQLLFAS